MSCSRCPHHVRHGSVSGKNIVFKDRCGLKMKTETPVDCKHVPFPQSFDYMSCEVYLQVFKIAGVRNDVVPTSDFEYSDQFNTSTSEMEYI